MATTYPARSHPWVHAAARRAAGGTDAELAAFADTGHAAALEKDQNRVPYDDGAALVTQDDRDYVEALAHIDPIDAVRDRAAAVATDAALASSCATAGSARPGSTRTRSARYVADEYARWQETRYLALTAVTVDRAAREGTASPLAAVRAWDNASTRFARQPAGWPPAEQLGVSLLRWPV